VPRSRPLHGNFGPEHVIMSAAGPRVVEYGITPPYGSATPSADMLAWAQTMMFAAIGRPPASYADLDFVPEPLRRTLADCLAGSPAMRPSARSVIIELLGQDLPRDHVLPAGSRRAALAAREVPDDEEYPGPAGTGEPGAHARERHAAHGRPAGQPFYRQPAVRVAGAAVAAVAVAAAVVVYLMQGPGSAGPGAGDPASPVSSNSNDPSLPPQPTAPVTVPPGFAGTWSGQARQANPPDEFQVRLTLPSGVSDGRVTYRNASFSCAGQLSPDTAGGGTLVLEQGIVSGRHTCADGVVVLTTGPGGTLHFSFHGKSGPVDAGILTRA
jgi:eukaryotic-like serine/threonine-protein kinase